MKVELAISSPVVLDVGQLAFGRPAQSRGLGPIGQARHFQQQLGLDHERARIGQAEGRPERVERDHAVLQGYRVSGTTSTVLGYRRPAGQAPSVDDAHAPFRQEPERERIDPVLGREHARGQRVRCVRVVHRHGGLRDQWPGFDFRHHQVHAGAMDLHPGRQCARVGVEPLEGGKERRMDVDHPAVPLPHEPGREQPHESRQAHDLDAMTLEARLQCALERLAVLAVVAVIDHRRGDAGRGRTLEAGRVRQVGEHEGDLGRIVGLACCGDQGRHVRPAPGNQHGGPLSRHPTHHARSLRGCGSVIPPCPGHVQVLASRAERVYVRLVSRPAGGTD